MWRLGLRLHDRVKLDACEPNCPIRLHGVIKIWLMLLIRSRESLVSAQIAYVDIRDQEWGLESLQL